MTKNLYELKKSHWDVVESTPVYEYIRSKNGNHAIIKIGDQYHGWDFDLLPGEVRNRDEEFSAWYKSVVEKES